MNRLRASRLANSASEAPEAPEVGQRARTDHASFFAVLPFIVWLALLAVVYRDAIGISGPRSQLDPIESFFFEAGKTVPALHFAIFAFVVWNRRFALAAGIRPSDPPRARILTQCFALALAGGGAGLLVWATRVDQIDLLIESLVLVLASGAVWVGGLRRLGQFVLPIAILWLARPWPPVLLHPMHEALQSLTGDIAFLVLSPFGEMTRSGHLLGFNGMLFQVIEGCSGLRITITLIFATLFYAELCSRSARQTLGLVVIAAFLGLLINGLRVILIMLAPTFDASNDHSVQGVIMIAFGIVVLGGIDRLGDRFLWPRGSRAWRGKELRSGDEDPSTAPRSGDWRSWSVPLVAALLLLGLHSAVPAAPPPPIAEWRLAPMGRAMDNWRIERNYEIDADQLGTVKFDDRFYRGYIGGDDRVRLFFATDDPRHREKSGLTEKTRSAGGGWEIQESAWLETSNGRSVQRDVQTRGAAETMSFHFRIGFSGLVEESLRWMLALDRAPSAEPVERAIVRISTEIVQGNRTAAQHRLERFLDAFETEIEAAAPPIP